MKKWRCPHCGQETIGFLDRWYSFFSIQRSYKKDYNGIPCKNCGGLFHTFRESNVVWNVAHIVLVLGLVCLAFVFPTWGWILAFLTMLSFLPVSRFLSLFYPVVAYSREDRRFIIPTPNTTVTIADSSKIKKLMIYGIEIKNAGNDPQLTKCFDKGVFAAMFLHSEQSNPNRWHIYIIKKELIPEQVLESGSEFTLTFQDKEIGTGAFV